MHQEILNNLNNKDNRTVWDCIDRPIKPLIVQLLRVGLVTKWCCCGFPYDKEEEPKTHAKKAFVVFKPFKHAPSKNAFADVCLSFIALGQFILGTRWELNPYSKSGEWHLMFNPSDVDFYRKTEGQIGIHNYETTLFNIQSLAKSLQEVHTVLKSATLRDGNISYDSMTNGEWQVLPAKDCTIEFDEKDPLKYRIL